jgi:hypothetical protein
MKPYQKALIILFTIVIFSVVVFKVKENFENILTEPAAKIIVNYDKLECGRLSNLQDTSNIPIVRNKRIVGIQDDKNKCYIKMNDNILNKNGKIDCTNANTNIYDPKFSSTISLEQGGFKDPYSSSYVETPVCFVNFKDTAKDSDVREYVNYLNKNDPELSATTALYDKEKMKTADLTQINANISSKLAETRASVVQAESEKRGLTMENQSKEAENKKLVETINNQGVTINRLQQDNRDYQQKQTFNPQNGLIKSMANDQKCADVWGWARWSGAPIITWQCHGGANQRWIMDDKMRMVAQNSGLCLDLNVGKKAIEQSYCHDGPNQKWIYDNKQRLRPDYNKDWCVDVNGVYDGSQLVVKNCSDEITQKWKSA